VSARRVTIRYRRPPAREDVFDQPVVHEADDHVVTLLEQARLANPLVVEGRTVLEDGAPVVWFTFPGAWHDVGRFHLADGTFTGHYANVLTPVAMDGARWDTTDLFLDVWRGSDGVVRILDEEEFAEAVARGWIAGEVADAARREADRLADAARRGEWPPAVVERWTLGRVRSALGA
jgi:uncharacterized protein